MRPWYRVSIVLVSMLGLMPMGGVRASEPEPSRAPAWCVISGHITRPDGEPAVDARVQLLLENQTSIAATDSTGEYVFAISSTWSEHTARITAWANGDLGGITLVGVVAGQNSANLRLTDFSQLRSTEQSAPTPHSTLSRTFFYATDRIRLGDSETAFGGELDTQLHYGTFVGSVDIGRADCDSFKTWHCASSDPFASSFRAAGPESAATAASHEPDTFFGQLAGQLKHPSPRVLVFIHGFNQSFDQAETALTRLVVTTGWDASPAILYSWPSKGSIRKYAADSDLIGGPAVIADFQRFLSQLAGMPERPQIYLFAHSMGNRLLLNALQNSHNLRGRIAAIAYLAADVNERDFAFASHTIASLTKRQRVYVSHNDLALRISDCHNDSRRLGEGPTSIGTDATLFDATEVASSDDWGHSYFGNTLPVASDLTDFVAIASSEATNASLRKVRWLGSRPSPALSPNEVLFESSAACAVVQALGF